MQARQKCAGTLCAAGYCKSVIYLSFFFFHFFGVEKVAEYSPYTKHAVSNTQNYFQGIVKDIFEMFSRLTGISLRRESDQNFAGITGAHHSKLTNGTVYLCSLIFSPLFVTYYIYMLSL